VSRGVTGSKGASEHMECESSQEKGGASSAVKMEWWRWHWQRPKYCYHFYRCQRWRREWRKPLSSGSNTEQKLEGESCATRHNKRFERTESASHLLMPSIGSRLRATGPLNIVHNFPITQQSWIRWILHRPLAPSPQTKRRKARPGSRDYRRLPADDGLPLGTSS
jgi:hypothetical protein